MKLLKTYLDLIKILKNAFYYKKRTVHPPVLPTRIWIEPTNLCNINCIMCPSSEQNKVTTCGHMSFDLYTNIIDEIKSFVIDINLFLRGEPFIHKDIIKMIKYAKNKGLRVRLETNATLLTKMISEQLIESNLDFISFSFDGYTEEIYNKIRVGADYNKTLSNIKTFLEIKKSMKTSGPFVLIQALEIAMVKEKVNPSDRKAFIDQFEGLPVNGFKLIPPHRFAGSIDKKIAGVTYGYMDVPHDKTHLKYTPCPYPWFSPAILWDGTVVPCCMAFSNQYVLGNVKDSTIEKIWHSEKLIGLRKKLINKDYCSIDMCKNCDLLWQKTNVGISTKSFKDVAAFLRESLT